MSNNNIIRFFALPGVLQGIGIYFVVEHFDFDQFNALLWGLLIALLVTPTVHFLSSSESKRLVSLSFALFLGVLCASLSVFSAARFSGGFQEFELNFFLFSLTVVSCVIISLVSLPFFRTIVIDGKNYNEYPSLFTYSWEHVVCLLVALLFSGAVSLVLLIAVGLFSIIGIHLDDIIFQSSVLLPVFGLSSGIAIGIARQHETIINSTRHVLLALVSSLLPVFALITGVFLVSASVTGLSAIDSALSVTLLLIMAVLFAIFLCNGAVRDSLEPVSSLLSLVFRVQALLLPLLVGLAAYGMIVRIGEYNFTHTRVISVVLICLIAMYALGYCLAALSKNINPPVQRVNTVMALVCLLACILLQTPVLDPYRLATRSQVSSLLAGETSIEQFDFDYLQFQAGISGRRSLESLSNANLENQTALDDAIASVRDLARPSDDSISSNSMLRDFNRWVKTGRVQLISAVEDPRLESLVKDSHFNFRLNSFCAHSSLRCVLVQTRAFNKQSLQYLMAIEMNNTEISVSVYFERAEGGWYNDDQDGGWNFRPIFVTEEDKEKLFDQLLQGQVIVQPITLNGMVLGTDIIVPTSNMGNEPLRVR